MPPRFRAVLFDLDGTLVDSYAAITASVNHVRAHHGLPPLEEHRVRGMVGHGLLQLMADVVPEGDPVRDAERYRAHHPSIIIPNTRLLPGVESGLRRLHAAGIRLAVCSNKPVAFTRQLLDALGINPFLDAAMGPEDAGKPKPDPAMLWLAMERMGVSHPVSLYVGDMDIDIQTARNAGITVWVLPTGSHDRATLSEARPDRIFDTFEELVPAILSDGND